MYVQVDLIIATPWACRVAWTEQNCISGLDLPCTHTLNCQNNILSAGGARREAPSAHAWLLVANIGFLHNFARMGVQCCPARSMVQNRKRTSYKLHSNRQLWWTRQVKATMKCTLCIPTVQVVISAACKENLLSLARGIVGLRACACRCACLLS